MNHAGNYAQALRTIGQDLEMLNVGAFDIETKGDDYLVRGEARRSLPEESRLQDHRGNRLRLIWNSWRGRSRARKGPSAQPPSSVALELRYTPEDVDRLEHDGRNRRRDPHGMPDIYSLSQVLRAVGAYVNRRNARLVEISKRNEAVTVQYETAEGRRNVEMHTVSSMYDFSVHMYKQRTDRER